MDGARPSPDFIARVEVAVRLAAIDALSKETEMSTHCQNLVGFEWALIGLLIATYVCFVILAVKARRLRKSIERARQKG